MGTQAVGELAHAFNRLIASLADDVRCAELPRECDAVGMPAEKDDLLGAESPRGDHAAQADGAVADDGDCLAGTDSGGESRVMARRHHIREGDQRSHDRVVCADRQDHERAVGLGDANRLALSSGDAVKAVPASVEAGGVQPPSAEDAGAV